MRRSPPALPSACLLLALAAAGCGPPQQPPVTSAGADARRAPELLRHYGCATCHSIPGVRGADAVVGPPLWAYAERGYVAGILPNSQENLARWIRDPLGVNPRTAMPYTGVTEQDARDMAAYLHTLYAQPVAVRMLHGFVERAVGRAVPQPPPPLEPSE